MRESRHWEAYMSAYQEMLRETSRPHAPWYAIPADEKPYMRKTVADIIVKTLRDLDPQFPDLQGEERAKLADYRSQIVNELESLD